MLLVNKRFSLNLNKSFVEILQKSYKFFQPEVDIRDFFALPRFRSYSDYSQQSHYIIRRDSVY